MLPFHPILLEDKKEFDTIVKPLGSYFCAHCFTDLFIWKNAYNTTVCFKDGFVFINQYSENQNFYLFPLGKGNTKNALDLIEQDAKERNHIFELYCLNEEEKNNLSLLHQHFDITEQRDNEDYIYTSESLMTLAGKKLHSKRNFVNRFKKEYEGRWQYEEITSENMHEVFEYHLSWCSLNGNNNSDDIKNETTAVSLCLKNFDTLELKGGILKLDGKIIAFTIGSKATDEMFVVHIEKADFNIPGAYQMINNQFAIHNFEGIKYINREEDLGIEGLRKAKLSYYPEFLPKNYKAVLK